ncbi:phosphoglycerol transferase MdoB-like AlkP superfamily enzyme [Gracilibacillus halotolerans]|uniref:Phosphoglycerol transferase MdoB-like AlkP superfamily enzyme n=1 Tax=Gracilibacillus halotolerans TaxID=74386 RepID=A0A841RJG3_9BACI|nr:LTA synthase family protein [Gracilibacillus halotolerans]MBB6511783.1 phosphoglycerol transferase MdoB-like AlkP superfamily enzyme [Gracilibacillus halotolerans]
MKKLQIPLYLIAALLFGLKTYIIYRFLFNISLDNIMQEFILFINAFIVAFFLLALSTLFKQRRQIKYMKYITLIGSLILYFNIVFYRNFSDFITIPLLFQGSNAADLGSSILSLIKVWDIVLFLDVVIIWYLAKKYGDVLTASYTKLHRRTAIVLSVGLLAFNYILAEIERPDLLQRTFDREYLVKNIGIFNYHVYDVVLQTKSKAQRVFADGNELTHIEEYLKEETKFEPSEEMHGVAEGKNVIFVWLESLQTFVLNNTMNGEEVTPFLNSLIDESYYFDNFYHQTEQGKTSDSEFLVDNSLYPLPSGAVYFTHAQNDYHSLPEILGNNGYFPTVFHANNKSFWNRDVMYDNLGYEHFFDVESYEVTEENSIGWGLKDKEFFEQSIPYMQEIPQPFYARFITLTNHYPFDLAPEDATIDKYDSNSRTLNNYFQTVRYLDESVEAFFQQLKDSGLYEDSIIVLMGDHYGISDFHKKAMSTYLDEEYTDYLHVQLQRVPLYIHIPGHDGEVISKISGQIDIKPTLLNLLGVDTSNDLTFGTDLFAEERKDFIALRDGSFITDEYVYTKETCYDRFTGEIIEGVEDEETGEVVNSCSPYIEQVEQELSYSDQIIYGDLFRFYDFRDQTILSEDEVIEVNN